jgi:exopolysaccharide biosynthesis polyprenyl glycosylphosphotransferase
MQLCDLFSNVHFFGAFLLMELFLHSGTWIGAIIALLLIAVVQESDWKRQLHALSPVSLPTETEAELAVRRVLIVGAGMVGQSLAQSLEAGGLYRVVGFVDNEYEDSPAAGKWNILGRREETTQIAREYAVDEVFIAYAPTWQQRLMEDMAVHCPSVRLQVVPSPYEAMMRAQRVRSYDDIALVRLTLGAGRVSEWIKRGFDIIAACLGLLVFSPVLLLVALLNRLLSPGPVIFTQERVGLQGKTFTLYKVRTMVRDAEAKTGPILTKGDADPRLTPIGRWLKRFRVDEIPQLWNVLKGDMSLVGPRPERPYFVQKFTETTPSYALRHQVRPGITGLAQVCGGYHTDARDKLRFDLIYASHHSLWMDLSILVQTLLLVFRS